MATSDEVDTAAGVNALGPKTVQQGNDSIEQHSLPDQIALANYLQSQQYAAVSATKPAFGLRFTRLNSTNGCG